MLNLNIGARWVAACAVAVLACALSINQMVGGASAQTTMPNISRGPNLPPSIDSIRAEASNRSVILNCVGPLQVRVTTVNANRPEQGYDIQAQFAPAASATDIRPGQCWRTGGWGNGALMESGGNGEFLYRSLLGHCPLISSVRMQNGAVAEIQSNDRINGQTLLNAGIRGGRFNIEARYLGRDMSTGSPRGPSRYLPTVAEGAMWRPAWCA